MPIAIVSTPPSIRNMDLTCKNTIRTLSMDGVQAEDSRAPRYAYDGFGPQAAPRPTVHRQRKVQINAALL